MATETKDATSQDSLEAFRKMRDTYLEGMSKVMIDAVNSEEYAQSTGAFLNNYLTVLAPFREALDKATQMTLEQFSLPSRQQVNALAERFTNIEMRLDDLDANLHKLIELSSRDGAKPAAHAEKRPTTTHSKTSQQARRKES